MLAYVITNGKCGKSGVPLCTALIDMYVKCENVAFMTRVLYGLCKASIICWTAMRKAYIHCNNLNEGMFPNEIMMLSLVKECGTTIALELGKLLHAFTYCRSVYAIY